MATSTAQRPHVAFVATTHHGRQTGGERGVRVLRELGVDIHHHVLEVLEARFGAGTQRVHRDAHLLHGVADSTHQAEEHGLLACNSIDAAAAHVNASTHRLG